jgi:hypothetical protein
MRCRARHAVSAPDDDLISQHTDTMPDLSHLLHVYRRYVEARNALLDELQLRRRSNRDPLAEFSEVFVAALVNGTLAESPVQKDWDVRRPTGETIQVKYLANPADRWVNEHEVRVNEHMDGYALVIFEALLPQAVVIFPARNLEAVGQALHKRHPNLSTTLQFTQANYRRICSELALFKSLGVEVYLMQQLLDGSSTSTL